MIGTGAVILIVAATVGERISEARRNKASVPQEFERSLVESQKKAATPIRTFGQRLKSWVDGEPIDFLALQSIQVEAASESSQFLAIAESIDVPDLPEARSLRMRSRETALEYRDLTSVAFPAILQIVGDGKAGRLEDRELAERRLREALVSVAGSEQALQRAQQELRWVMTKGPNWK